MDHIKIATKKYKNTFFPPKKNENTPENSKKNFRGIFVIFWVDINIIILK